MKTIYNKIIQTLNHFKSPSPWGRLGGALLVGLSFTSCSLYQKYQRPAMVTDSVNVMRDVANYARSSSAGSAFSAENTTDSTGFGDVAWREVFTDPQLQTLIQQGLDKNVDLYSAAQSIKKLEAALKCARLAFLPAVNFTPSGTLSKIATGQNAGNEWSKIYALPITASWSADIFGNILSQKRAAEMNLQMSKDAEQAVRSQIICGIATSYYTLLMLDRQMEILNDMEKLTLDTWNMMKLQKDLRGAKETSVISAQAAYLSVKSQKVDMQRQITETENALSLLIEQPAQAVSRGKLAAQNLPSKFSTGIPVKTLANRPDVHAKEMTMASDYYAITSAKAQFYPSFTISATGSWTNSVGTILNPGQILATFVASLVQPIFQNGRLTASLKIAKISFDVAEKEWQHSLLNAGAEVSNALVEYNSAKAKGDFDRQQVDILGKSVNYTRDLFKMGSSTYLEVISAQSSLLNAEISQVTDDYNKMAAVVSLYSALGGGRK